MLLLSFLLHLFCAVNFIIGIYRKIYTFGTVCGFRHLLASGNASKGEPPGGLSRVITECPRRCCLFVMARPPVFNTVRSTEPALKLAGGFGNSPRTYAPRPLSKTCGKCWARTPTSSSHLQRRLLPCPACPLQPCWQPGAPPSLLLEASWSSFSLCGQSLLG